MITRVLRTASCGIALDPKVRPSSVTLFWAVRCPATEKPLAVESVPATLTTPGASAARAVRSLWSSSGSR